MGAVSRASDTNLDRQVAIKIVALDVLPVVCTQRHRPCRANALVPPACEVLL